MRRESQWTGVIWNTFSPLLIGAAISAAARGLGVSQPTISEALARMEKECGLTLVRRGSRGSHPDRRWTRSHRSGGPSTSGIPGFGSRFASIERRAAGSADGRMSANIGA